MRVLDFSIALLSMAKMSDEDADVLFDIGSWWITIDI